MAVGLVDAPAEATLMPERQTVYFDQGFDEPWMLYAADPDCAHVIRIKWSGIECERCHGWFCY
jgi:hypothetical protein